MNIKFEENEIFKYNGLRLAFGRTIYSTNYSPAVIVVEVDDNNKCQGIYDTLTVNLEAYGFFNTNEWVAIHHDFMNEYSKPIVDEFIGRFGTGEIEDIRYGFAKSVIVEVKDIFMIKVIE